MDTGLTGRRAAAARIGADAVPLVADASTAEGVRPFVSDARDALGGLDVLVTNAGGPPPGNFGSTPYEAYPPAGFLKTLAREVARDGVTVNSVQPGTHATERIFDLYRDPEQAAAGIPAGELGRPEDFGAFVAFLCSDSARFITGAAIPVDGGSSTGLL